MNLFNFKDYVLQVEPIAWSLTPFKAILKRDKSRNKDLAMKEMLFIYYYTDIKSDYLIMDEPERIREIIKDIKLPEDWKFDQVMKDAVQFYEERSLTVIGKMYRNAMVAANDVSNYLLKTKELLEERDNNNKPIYTLPVVLGGLSKIKLTMQELKAAEKELIKEKVETEGRMKGSREMGMFEGGLTI